MSLPFYKYQCTGNDFIVIDNRELVFNADTDFIAQLCHRKLGIGADGLILLQKHAELDFKMLYYNSDGQEGSFCGNGGRAIVHFGSTLGLLSNKARFSAIDGVHEATILENNVSLKMLDVNKIEIQPKYYFLDTGSPHYVTFVKDVAAVDLVKEGKKIRYNERFRVLGTNVNFVESKQDTIKVRTYERGVEDETLSCGTGVVASALSYSLQANNNDYCKVETTGGDLLVKFKKSNSGFQNIWLKGTTTLVFKGEISDIKPSI